VSTEDSAREEVWMTAWPPFLRLPFLKLPSRSTILPPTNNERTRLKASRRRPPGPVTAPAEPQAATGKLKAASAPPSAHPREGALPRLHSLEADGLLTFRVSDAVRRRKVGGARTRGPRAMVYGDFDFGRLWAVAGAAEDRTYLKADRLLSGGREGCSKSDGPLSGGWSPLFDRAEADSGIPGNVVVTGSVGDVPCRVTTLLSRMTLRRMAAREVGTGVPRSQ